MKHAARRLSPAALALSGITAALYVLFTVVPPFSALSFFAVQIRFSEALTVLPFLFPETAAGLVAGCLISNFFSPLILPLDLILGTAATALGAVGTLSLRKCKNRRIARFFAGLPPLMCNTLIVPVIVCLSTPSEAFLPVYAASALSVGLGEAAAACGLGIPLILLLEKTAARFNRF